MREDSGKKAGVTPEVTMSELWATCGYRNWGRIYGKVSREVPFEAISHVHTFTLSHTTESKSTLEELQKTSRH